MELYLRCPNFTHDDIFLPDGKVVLIGRSPSTKIIDKRCSRNHIQVVADYLNKSLSVKQIGKSCGYIDDEILEKDKNITFKEGSTLYVVEKEYPQILYVKLKEDNADEPSRKRTLSDYFGNHAKPSKKCKTDLKENKNDISDDEGDENIIKKKLEKLQNQTSVNKKNKAIDQEQHADCSTSNITKLVKGKGWYKVDTMLVYEPDELIHSSNILAFDMDGTLITTKSGKTFAVDKNDWKILYSEIPLKLKEFQKKDQKLVIITNQLGIGKGKVKESDFKEKVEAILNKLNVPMMVLAITKRGKYRKPNIGSYNWLTEHGNGEISCNKFMYVGDAAGRPKNWAPGKKKDFSCSDRLFTLNLGRKFATPEEFFLSHKSAKFDMPIFDPKNVPKHKTLTNCSPLTRNTQELIVLVGYPACGKSTFARNKLVTEGYVHINRDTLKTWQRCVAACDKALASGKSVVVDNTNPDKASRKRYLECAKKNNCESRCFLFDISIEHAFHNNRFRELSGHDHDIIPAMVLYSFRKNYVEPELAEGFEEIVRVNFIPTFKNENEEKSYHMFLD